MRARVVGLDSFTHCFSCCKDGPCEKAKTVGVLLDVSPEQATEMKARLRAGDVLLLKGWDSHAANP